MTRLTHRYIVLCGKEQSYGTEPQHLEALPVWNMNLRPLVAKETEVPSLLTAPGNGKMLLGHRHVEITFSVLLTLPSPTTKPFWEPLLQACGWRLETTENARKYMCHTPSQDSLTLHIHKDGSLHKLLGARGNVTLHVLPSEVPRMDFSFQGLYQSPVDEVLPSVNNSDWGQSLPSLPSSTIVARFYGQDIGLANLSVDMGGEISLLQQSTREEVVLLNRYPSGNLTFSDDGLADCNWFSKAEQGQNGSLQWEHGLAQGVYVVLEIPSLQIADSVYGDLDGLQTRTIRFRIPMSYTINDFLTLKIMNRSNT